jgi:hypothetical protein
VPVDIEEKLHQRNDDDHGEEVLRTGKIDPQKFQTDGNQDKRAEKGHGNVHISSQQRIAQQSSDDNETKEDGKERRRGRVKCYYPVSV